MTDLKRLKVSLTKHGAHKLATLLRMYDKDQVLDHVWGAVDGVHVELAQAKKNLSVGKDGVVPEVWNKVRVLGDPSIDALVLIGIIASHHTIMEALISGKKAVSGTGVIERGLILKDKSFTNVAHIIEQLGFSTEHTTSIVRYDFSRIFKIPKLHKLAGELLALKLNEAGWDRKSNLADELIANNFHKVFSVSEQFFREWLEGGDVLDLGANESIDDLDFFATEDDDAPSVPFKFLAGHKPKRIGEIDISPRSKVGKALLLHNEMQTKLYAELVNLYGKACVGTELPSGNGATAIDLVVKTKEFCWFYEIKTAQSVRACIRQAIPQLLEYAYWGGIQGQCDKLIIVGPKPVTKAASAYLEFLRKTFGMELHYKDCQLPPK